MTAIYWERTAQVWCDDNMWFRKQCPFRFSFENWRKDGSCHHLAPCSPLYQILQTTHIHMRQWTGSASVQAMINRPYSVASHYINQCWLVVNWTHRNKPRWNLNQQITVFVQENDYGNIVHKVTTIFFRPQLFTWTGVSVCKIGISLCGKMIFWGTFCE